MKGLLSAAKLFGPSNMGHCAKSRNNISQFLLRISPVYGLSWSAGWRGGRGECCGVCPGRMLAHRTGWYRWSLKSSVSLQFSPVPGAGSAVSTCTFLVYILSAQFSRSVDTEGKKGQGDVEPD